MKRLLLAAVVLTLAGCATADYRDPGPRDDAAKVADDAEYREMICSGAGERNRDTEELTPATPNMIAALRRGDWEAVKVELALASDVPDDASPAVRARVAHLRRGIVLTSAAARGDADEVRDLLATDVDVDQGVLLDDSLSPMGWAARCDRAAVLTQLLAAGAQIDKLYYWTINPMGEYDDTPLMLAAEMSALEAVNTLLAAGADPNAFRPVRPVRGRPEISMSPLMVDTSYAILEVLLDYGADPNLANDFGRTPLMEAANINDPGKITLLLSYGANPARRDEDGKTAADLARGARAPEALAALLAPPPATLRKATRRIAR